MGSKFLKVTGILMIIFGSIGLVFSLIAIAGIGVLAALGASTGMLWASGIIALVGSVAEFVAGIIGVVNWNKPEKANTCIGWGIAVAAMCVVSSVLSFIGYPDSFNWFSLVSGLVIPVLYLIGAFQNKKLG